MRAEIDYDLSGVALTVEAIRKLPRGFVLVGRTKIKDPYPPDDWDGGPFDAKIVDVLVVDWVESYGRRRADFDFTGEYMGDHVLP